MYNVTVGGNIQKGDLIAVANSNDFRIGIYFGRGVGGTVQYYHPSVAPYAKQSYENRLLSHGLEQVGPFKIGLIYKDYVNSPRDTRIMKLNRDNITDQKMVEDIEKSKEILKQFNIDVNY